MPLYFFNLYDDLVSIDEEGKDLPDPASARFEAITNARELACAEVVEGHLHLDHRIEVADAFGEVIDTVWFRDIVQVTDRPPPSLNDTMPANRQLVSSPDRC